MMHIITSKTPSVPKPIASSSSVGRLSLIHKNFMLTQAVDSGSSMHWSSTVSHLKILETTAR